MTTIEDLQAFFARQDFRMIIAADAETHTAVRKKDSIVNEMRAGGVATALEPIARSSQAFYIARGKTEEDRLSVGSDGKLPIQTPDGNYTLKRLFFNEQDLEAYYYGFSNQTLWPLCHVAFEKPIFQRSWFEGYRKVNQRFADAIKSEIKGKSFVWLHDYQLALVPRYLGKPKNTTVGMFWHIPWPTWEVFRILPEKKEILESMLMVDYLAFHRGYQARNFLQTVRRELEARIDLETNKVYYNGNVTTVGYLPLGIDTDMIVSQVHPEAQSLAAKLVDMLFPREKSSDIMAFFQKHKVILGIDRLDYTKGIDLRLHALDRFFEKNPGYIGKAVYIGIIAPSREIIPSYRSLRRQVQTLSDAINEKYRKKDWQPINLVYQTFPRDEVLNFYNRSDVCLVTPLDDGMNLVSKEFVVAASLSSDPGMLILSQFAGSSVDLTEAIIVNPYDINEVAEGIKKGLEMSSKERIQRNADMVRTLEERNVYAWAQDFIKNSLAAHNK